MVTNYSIPTMLNNQIMKILTLQTDKSILPLLYNLN